MLGQFYYVVRSVFLCYLEVSSVRLFEVSSVRLLEVSSVGL